MTRTLEDSGVPIIIDDPNETAVLPLYWYAQKLWGASDDVFEYSDEPRELRKSKVLSDKLVGPNGSGRRYQVNPPFRCYLDVAEG